MKDKKYILLFVLPGILILTTCNKIEKEMLVSTGTATDIFATTAKVSGEVMDLGEGATRYGHCYSTSANPTVSNTKTELGVPVLGNFTSNLTGLAPGTRYYLKAYCSRGKETVYGDEINFTTATATQPVLSTTVITGISKNSSVTGGKITNEGGSSVTACGVCWNVVNNPTTSDNKTVDEMGTGTFISNLTGLLPGTNYYIRAYATNSYGTGYGDVLSFMTLQPPGAVTTAANSVTTIGASLRGTVNAYSYSTTVTFEYGMTVAYGSSKNADQNPLTGNTGTTVSANIAGLTPGTTYHFRVCAVSSQGTTYGDDQVFVTVPTTIEDSEGNIYNTITIGEQTWLKENLRVKHYRNGEEIGTTSIHQSISSESSPKYQWSHKEALLEYGTFIKLLIDGGIGGYTFAQAQQYGFITIPDRTNLEYWATSLCISSIDTKTIQVIYNECTNPSTEFSQSYGRLYTWYTITDNRNICPAGWHVSSDSDWKKLEMFLGMTQIQADATGFRGTDQADQLKESGTTHWVSPNSGTNSSGFTAIPAGLRGTDGRFYNIYSAGVWWTGTEKNTDYAWGRTMQTSTSTISRFDQDKKGGYSVRCVKD